MESLPRYILPFALFLLTIFLGFWLSKRGKPYPGLLFNIHKLSALAGIILIILQTVKNWDTFPDSSQMLPVLIIAATGVLMLFASGGFLSALKWKFSLLLHRLGLAVLVLSFIWTVIVM